MAKFLRCSQWVFSSHQSQWMSREGVPIPIQSYLRANEPLSSFPWLVASRPQRHGDALKAPSFLSAAPMLPCFGTSLHPRASPWSESCWMSLKKCHAKKDSQGLARDRCLVTSGHSSSSYLHSGSIGLIFNRKVQLRMIEPLKLGLTGC